MKELDFRIGTGTAGAQGRSGDMDDTLELAQRWRAAVVNLRQGADRIRSIALDLPLDLAVADAFWAGGARSDPLHKHLLAVADYTTALNCVQALLAARSPGAR